MKKYIISLMLLLPSISCACDVYRNHHNDQLINNFRSTIKSNNKDLKVIKKKIKVAENKKDTLRLQHLYYKLFVIRQQITWNTLQLAYAMHGDYYMNKKYSEREEEPVFLIDRYR